MENDKRSGAQQKSVGTYFQKLRATELPQRGEHDASSEHPLWVTGQTQASG